jgi:impB/mucB/samB family C-terminal domain
MIDQSLKQPNERPLVQRYVYDKILNHLRDFVHLFADLLSFFVHTQCSYGVRFQGGTYGVDYMIEGLAREVEKRMGHVAVRGSKVTLKIKQRKKGAPPPPKFLGHGSCHNLSKSLDASKPTREWSDLAKLGKKAFESMKMPADDVRGMGLIVSKLVVDGKDDRRQGIKQWFQPSKPTENDCSSPQVQDDHSKFKAAESVALNKASDDMIDGADETVDLQAESEDDDDSVEILVHPGSSSIPCDVDDCDIALPALSQIRMSQVQVLPSPMRRQITSKMEMERKSKVRAAEMMEAGAVSKPRLRQTNVQRVLRLAAVKAGHQDSATDDSRRFSLGQLESLPFEVQLQVTNNDDLGVGTLSEPSHTHRKKQQHLAIANNMTKAALSLSTRSNKAELPPRAAQALLLPFIEFDVVEGPNEFFEQNVFPLSLFLDEHSSDSDAAALNHILEFFRLLVEENRHWDVARLLRSIRSRTDGWGGSTKIFQDIFEAVDSYVMDATGMQVDID